jgi:hypothetical protein
LDKVLLAREIHQTRVALALIDGVQASEVVGGILVQIGDRVTEWEEIITVRDAALAELDVRVVPSHEVALLQAAIGHINRHLNIN